MDKIGLIAEEYISRNKLIEKNLMENNSILMHTLKELEKAQEQLVQLDKLVAIGQLAAGVAHEINNPLGFIYSNFETSVKYFNQYKEIIKVYKNFINYLKPYDDFKAKIEEIEILEQKYGIEIISSDLEDLFNDIEDGLKRISGTVKGLKTFARVSFNDEFEDYNLNNGIKNTMTIARSSMKYYANYIESLGKIPFIKAKGSEINQVLLNIILNAVYAIKSKNQNELGTIIVSTNVVDNFVKCEIEDNGVGIDSENLNKIFNPFFTTKPIGHGTGLGLSIAYDIVVNKHRGSLLVDSKLGVGTKFTIMLPINKIE